MKLNLPEISLKYKSENGQKLVYDSIRNKYLVSTPEEVVRQHFVQYLVQYLHYPAGRICIERGFDINGLQRRVDILIYDSMVKPDILVECKAPNVKIGQKELDQIVVYNMHFKAQTLVLTNGLMHYAFKINSELQQIEQLKTIPVFSATKK